MTEHNADSSQSSPAPPTEIPSQLGGVETSSNPRNGLFNSRISPMSLSSAFLASTAVFMASSVGLRWLTISLALLGLAVGLLGVLVYRGRDGNRSVFLSATGGVLSGAILLLALFLPSILNPFWTSDSPLSASDSNEYIVVPRNKTRGSGKPLAATDWVDASVDGIRQGDLFIQLQSAVAGRLPDKGTTTYLLVNLRLDQMKDGQSHRYERYIKGKLEPKLSDDSGREFAFLGDRIRKSPSKFDRLFLVDQLLVFELPPKAQFLNLVLPASVWGREGECRFRISEIVNEPPPDMAKLIADTKAMLRRPSPNPPERALGRSIFAKKCQECHTFFGSGGKTGPDLTASKRNDLDFLLTSIIDPSAVIEKKYQPTIVITTTGIVYNGIVQKEDADAITLLVPSRLVVVPRSEIEEMRISNVSLMPTDLLKDLTDFEIRSLIAYLSGTSQAAMLATPENVPHFFPPAEDLSNWHSNGPKWKVEKGVVLAPEPVEGKASQLIGDLHFVNDFHMTLRFNPGKDGRGAILIGDAGEADFSNAIRVELAGDEPLAIAGIAAKISRVESSAKAKSDLWNKLEIVILADHIDLKLNDKDAVSATGIVFPQRRVIAMEGPGDLKRDMRFRNLSIRLLGREN
jgi:putative heme-binding domain-containing protein